MTPGSPQDTSSDSNYGEAVKPCPFAKKTWIAIQLVGEDDKPVPGVSYRVLLADGSAREGVLDSDGSARIDGIAPGTCMVTFPGLDQDAWDAIAS